MRGVVGIAGNLLALHYANLVECSRRQHQWLLFHGPEEGVSRGCLVNRSFLSLCFLPAVARRKSSARQAEGRNSACSALIGP